MVVHYFCSHCFGTWDTAIVVRLCLALTIFSTASPMSSLFFPYCSSPFMLMCRPKFIDTTRSNLNCLHRQLCLLLVNTTDQFVLPIITKISRTCHSHRDSAAMATTSTLPWLGHSRDPYAMSFVVLVHLCTSDAHLLDHWVVPLQVTLERQLIADARHRTRHRHQQPHPRHLRFNHQA